MAGYKKLNAVAENVSDEIQTANVQPNSYAVQVETIRKYDFEFRSNELSRKVAQFGDSIKFARPEERAYAVKQNPQLTLEMFTSLLSVYQSKQNLAYIVTLLADITECNESAIIIAKADEKMSLFPSLLSILNKDPFSASTACLCFGRLAAALPAVLDAEIIGQYMFWILPHLKHTNEYLECLTKAVMMFLKKSEYRSAFYDNNGLKHLLDLLDHKLNFQFQYELIFSIWMLSFEKDIVNRMKEYPVAVVLCDVLKTTNRLKVQRVILATFKNLVDKSEPEVSEKFSGEMIHFKTLPVLNVLESKSLEDPDFEADVKFLQEKLTISLQDLSSFDEYTTEVLSGRLEWSPVHKSDKFWRENVMKLNEKDYNLLRMLVAVLAESQSPTAVAVAAHDLGEYVRYYPRGKRVIDKLGAKEKVMSLVNHDNTEVRMQALLSIQKMMVQNWEYLGKQLESKA